MNVQVAKSLRRWLFHPDFHDGTIVSDVSSAATCLERRISFPDAWPKDVLQCVKHVVRTNPLCFNNDGQGLSLTIRGARQALLEWLQETREDDHLSPFYRELLAHLDPAQAPPPLGGRLCLVPTYLQLAYDVPPCLPDADRSIAQRALDFAWILLPPVFVALQHHKFSSVLQVVYQGKRSGALHDRDFMSRIPNERPVFPDGEHRYEKWRNDIRWDLQNLQHDWLLHQKKYPWLALWQHPVGKMYWCMNRSLVAPTWWKDFPCPGFDNVWRSAHVRHNISSADVVHTDTDSALAYLKTGSWIEALLGGGVVWKWRSDRRGPESWIFTAPSKPRPDQKSFSHPQGGEDFAPFPYPFLASFPELEALYDTLLSFQCLPHALVLLVCDALFPFIEVVNKLPRVY